nr:MAG TPA: hypothetical protein [Caudoviricetes sp.]
MCDKSLHLSLHKYLLCYQQSGIPYPLPRPHASDESYTEQDFSRNMTYQLN